jgi:hypothetical protein
MGTPSPAVMGTPSPVGRLWGMIAVGSGQEPLRLGTEQRTTEVTELVATAVANAQSWAELMTLACRPSPYRSLYRVLYCSTCSTYGT